MKPRIAIFSLTGCEGCSLAILELENELLDILDAVEGNTSLNECPECYERFGHKEWCEVHLLLREAQTAMRRVLASRSLAQLAVESLDRRAQLEETAPLQRMISANEGRVEPFPPYSVQQSPSI